MIKSERRIDYRMLIKALYSVTITSLVEDDSCSMKKLPQVNLFLIITDNMFAYIQNAIAHMKD